MQNTVDIVADSFSGGVLDGKPSSLAARRNSVQSIAVGAELLRGLAEADEPQSLGALARVAGMTPPKAHRYLAGFVEAGLVVQSDVTGAYDLGPLAVQLGLAALRRYQSVAVAGERLAELRDAVDQTVLLSVWGAGGPTVARIELSRHPVTLAVRVGTTFPVLTSATGRIFLAFAERGDVAAVVASELEAAHAAHAGTALRTPGDVAALAAAIRTERLAYVDQTFLVGVEAIAVPLFEPDGRLAAAITVIGRARSMNVTPAGPLVRELRAFVGR